MKVSHASAFDVPCGPVTLGLLRETLRHGEIPDDAVVTIVGGGQRDDGYRVAFSWTTES